MNADSESDLRTVVKVLTQEFGKAAVELVRLRCEVLQLQHENRRLKVQLVHARRMVESESSSDAAAYRLAWSEVVREACKGGRDDD